MYFILGYEYIDESQIASLRERQDHRQHLQQSSQKTEQQHGKQCQKSGGDRKPSFIPAMEVTYTLDDMINLETFGDTAQNDRNYRKARNRNSHTPHNQHGNVYEFPQESSRGSVECIEDKRDMHVITNDKFDDLEDKGTCKANRKDDGLYMKLNKDTMEPWPNLPCKYRVATILSTKWIACNVASVHDTF